MEKSSTMKLVFGLLAVFTLLFVTPSWAQKANPAAKAPAKEKAGKLPYCDQAAGFYGPDLQSRANLECRTVQPCVDCIDRANNKQTCVRVTVQPNQEASCRAQIKAVDDAKTAQAAPNKAPTPDQNDFMLTLLQNPCYFDGITLQVQANRLNSTLPDNPKDYTYAWTIDNMPMGNSNYVYCASGRIASVKVTQIATGRSMTKSVEIHYRDHQDMKKDLAIDPVNIPFAGYRKTGCYGECPAYSVEFYEDGTVTWNGILYTQPLGTKTGKISADAITKLKDKAREIGFLKLNDSYPDGKIADAESTILFMHLDGKKKQVTDVFGSPDGLKDLEKQFDNLIKQLGWAKSKTFTPTKKKVEKPSQNKASSGN